MLDLMGQPKGPVSVARESRGWAPFWEAPGRLGWCRAAGRLRQAEVGPCLSNTSNRNGHGSLLRSQNTSCAWSASPEPRRCGGVGLTLQRRPRYPLVGTQSRRPQELPLAPSPHCHPRSGVRLKAFARRDRLCLGTSGALAHPPRQGAARGYHVLSVPITSPAPLWLDSHHGILHLSHCLVLEKHFQENFKHQ